MLTPRRAGLAAALATLAGGLLTSNHHLVGVFYDDAQYANLAWALAHGLGYVHPNLPGRPVAVHYPPLYPVILSPLFGLWPVSTAALVGKAFNMLCAAASSGLIVWHAMRIRLIGGPAWLPGCVVVAAALSIPCLTVLTVLLSEPVFTLFVAVAVIFADRPTPGRFSPDAAALISGAAAALAFLARSLGGAVAAGVVVWTYFTHVHRVQEGRAAGWRRVALAAAPSIVAGLGWGAWVMIHQGGIDPIIGSDYGSYLELVAGSGVAMVGARVTDLVRPLGVLTLSWTVTGPAYYACGIAALAVGFYGLVELARRSAIGGALVLYLALLACWPVPPDRFLWAVLPWIALGWAAGAVALWRHTRLRIPVAVLAAILVGGYARYEARGFAHQWWDLAAARMSDTLGDMLPALDSLPQNAVVATDHDPLVWLYTRRLAVPLYVYRMRGNQVLEPPPAVHRAYLDRQGVTHLLVAAGDEGGLTELQRLLTAYPARFELRRRWANGGALFGVRSEP
ncbi:MAG TPA: hypothetical protein VLV16_08010 [Gemmatimonadales bacterium]|nr:hypothetical protein [Gemmatimonadales bacterium]